MNPYDPYHSFTSPEAEFQLRMISWERYLTARLQVARWWEKVLYVLTGRI